MSNITVNVTNAGLTNVAVSNGSTVNATVGNGGVVNVALGTISSGNATVVSGTLTINSTTTLAAGSSAYAKNVGTSYAASLDLGIPAGPATLVTVGNTTTLAAANNATVTSNLSGNNLTLAFGIPQGANGVTPSFAIGNVVTGAAGSSASVAATATNSGANVTLDLTIPRGDPGTGGSNGTSVTLSDGTPANLGSAAAGTSNLSARADHIHNLPVIAYSNLSGLPANFPTNTTLVSGLNSSYSGIAHGHNYVTALNNLTGSLTLAAGSNVTLTTNGSTLTLSSSAGGLGANDAVDGGDYIGELLYGITFGTQPQSQTLTSSTTMSLGSFTPQAQNGLPLGASQYGQTLAGSIAGSDVASFGSRLYTVRFWNNSSYGGGTSNVPAVATSADNGATWSQLLTLSGGLEGSWGRKGDVSIASNGTRHIFTSGWTLDSTAPADSSVRYSDYADMSNMTLSNTAIGGAMSVAYSSTAARWCALNYPVYNGTGHTVSVFSSSDGNSWTHRVIMAGQSGKIISCGNRLIAASDQQGLILKSTDGVSWSNGATNVATVYDLASNGTRAVMVGRGYSNNNFSRCYYTADGDTWANVTLPVPCTRISYASGLFCAWNDGVTGTDLCTSPDGVTWTLRTLPSAANLAGAASADGSNNIFFTSSSNTSYNAVLSTSAASASLTVSASVSGGAAVSYQWQSSTDAGTTWANVSNATSSTLSLTGLTTANSGTRYRASASATGATTVTSQSATLTVTG